MCVRFGLPVVAVGEKPEYGLPYRHAVLHLREDAGARMTGHQRRMDVDIADDRARMHEDGVRFRERKALLRDAERLRIFAKRRDESFRAALFLYPQGVYDIRSRKRFFHIMEPRYAEGFDRIRNERLRRR